MVEKDSVRLDPGPSDPANHTLHMLQGMRRELGAMLENQRRDRELITRLALSVEQGFGDVRRDISELKSDMVLLENVSSVATMTSCS